MSRRRPRPNSQKTKRIAKATASRGRNSRKPLQRASTAGVGRASCHAATKSAFETVANNVMRSSCCYGAKSRGIRFSGRACPPWRPRAATSEPAASPPLKPTCCCRGAAAAWRHRRRGRRRCRAARRAARPDRGYRPSGSCRAKASTCSNSRGSAVVPVIASAAMRTSGSSSWQSCNNQGAASTLCRAGKARTNCRRTSGSGSNKCASALEVDLGQAAAKESARAAGAIVAGPQSPDQIEQVGLAEAGRQLGRRAAGGLLHDLNPQYAPTGRTPDQPRGFPQHHRAVGRGLLDFSRRMPDGGLGDRPAGQVRSHRHPTLAGLWCRRPACIFASRRDACTTRS